MSRYFWVGARPEGPEVLAERIATVAFLKRSLEIPFTWSNDDLEIRIRRDGLVLLRVERIEHAIAEHGESAPIDATLDLWREYLEHASCLMLLLSSCVLRGTKTQAFTLFPLTNREVFRPEIDFSGKVDLRGVSQDGFAAIYHLIAQTGDRRVTAAQLLGAVVVPGAALADLGPQLNTAASTPVLLRRLATLSRAHGEFQLGNFPLSIVLSFFVIEDTLNDRWMSWIDGKNADLAGQKRVNADRRKTMAGRDYPVSVVTNLLELQDLVSFEQYTNINAVRAWRNRIVHQDPKRPARDDAQQAVATALDLVVEGTGLEIRLPFGIMVPGL